MKKILLVTAIPAMLFAVACSAATSNEKASTLKQNDDFEQTKLNIACKNCLVGEKEGGGRSKILMKTYQKETHADLSVALDTSVSTAKLPSEIKVTTHGKVIEKDEGVYTYKIEEGGSLAALIVNFTGKQDVVSILIDATTECMDFDVTFESGDDHTVKFNYNGALSHIDWGDESEGGEHNSTHTFAGEGGSYHVRVYGDLSSVWFTNRSPKFNGPLSDGNNCISKLNINHTITNIPSYAFNGCLGLSETYIGDSVSTIGKKAFTLNDVSMRDYGHNAIYTSQAEQPSGWNDEWTDCPVRFGVEPTDMNVIKDSKTKFEFRVFDDRAYITGGEIGDTCQIPKEVTPTGGDAIPVYGIVPFAFYGTKGEKITEISFEPGDIAQGTTNISEIGDYAFAESGAKNVDFSGIVNPESDEFRIGCGAFYDVPFKSADPEFHLKFGVDGKIQKDCVLIIDDKAFSETKGLTSIQVSGGSQGKFTLNTIHKSAFEGSSIQQIWDGKTETGGLLKTIRTIEDYAFAQCSGLKTPFVIPDTVETVGEKIFSETKSKTFNTLYVQAETIPDTWNSNWNDRELGEKATKFPVVKGFIELFPYGNLVYNITKAGDKKEATLAGPVDGVKVENLTVPATIEYKGENVDVVAIGMNAFESYEPLQSVEFEDKSKVTTISERAFSGCDALTTATIPDNVTTVGKEAFANCSSLLKIFYKGKNTTGWAEDWCGQGADTMPRLYTDYLDYKDVGSVSPNFVIIQQNTQDDDGKYNSIIAGRSASIIGQKLEIPDEIVTTTEGTYKITSLGDRAFEGGGFEKGISFEKATNLTSIGAGTFRNVTFDNTDLALPANVEKIGKYVFDSVKKLPTIDMSKTKITNIPDYAFCNAQDLTTVVLPDPGEGSITFGESAFQGCSNITSVDLSKTNIKKVPNYLFSGCEKYAGNLPTTVETIGASAFNNTQISVDFANCSNLTEISDAAFQNCSKLTSVILPAGFTTIGNYAFSECGNLIELDLSNISTMLSIEKASDLLFNCKHFGYGDTEGKIYVPAELLETYKTDGFWKKYADCIKVKS